MARGRLDIRVRIVFTNDRAVDALDVVTDFLDDMLETFPDRSDVRRAVKAARYAKKHIDVVQDDDDEDEAE